MRLIPWLAKYTRPYFEVGDRAAFTVQLNDDTGRELASGKGTLAVTFTMSPSTAAAAAAVTDAGDGTYFVVLTAASEGAYVIIVTLDGAAVGAGDNTASGTGTVTEGEYHFNVLAGDISPKSTLEGYTVGSTGTVSFTVGAAVALALLARDSAGTARSVGGESSTIKAVFPGATVTITDHANGTYGISFTAPSLAGTGYQLAVTVDGEIITGTYDFGVVSGPIAVTVDTGPPTAATFLSLADVTAGEAVVLPVRVTDALGNPIAGLASGSSPRLVLTFDDVANSVAPTEPSLGVYR